jgi:putative phosphoesterase
MRIVIVSDIHGNLMALDAVIADVATQAPDLVLHGGDLAAIGPRPAEVVDRIRELGWPGVAGNTEEMMWSPELREVQTRQAPRIRDWLAILFDTLSPWAADRLGEERVTWLKALPHEQRSGELSLIHASPGNLWSAPMPSATDDSLASVYGRLHARLAVYGHIHRPFVRVLDGLRVANSGSVGLPYDGDWRPSYLLVDDGVPTIRRVEYNLQRGHADLARSGFPLSDWLAEVQRRGTFIRPAALLKTEQHIVHNEPLPANGSEIREAHEL